MARVFSEDDLSNILVDDFNWRLKEISIIRKLAQSIEHPKRRTIIRAGIPLLYAHWEGYVKFSAQKYLEFVGGKRIKYRDLSPNFLFLSNVGHLRRVGSVGSSVKLQTEIVLDIASSPDDTNKENHAKKVNTKSNLNSEVFSDICMIINIDPVPYENDFGFIDKIVVEKRNHVAHGAEVSDRIEDFVKNSDKVLGLMRRFRTDVENAAIAKTYRR